jgi:2-polyprenyl-3-methyl-5-hydroxy-6-metoxy-1,4-benzoquinol methylase
MTVGRHSEQEPSVARLREFWNSRYKTFSLQESGWLGAGDTQNNLLYAGKANALQRALHSAEFDRRSGCSVLDAGCGQGFFAKYYQAAHPDWHYTGIDISETLIDHLRSRYPTLAFEAADVTSWRPSNDERFDVIQGFELLHVLTNDELLFAAIANLASQLRPNGLLLLTTVLPKETVTPTSYLRHLSRRRFIEMVGSVGLQIEAEYDMYYWLPDGGPSNRYLRFAFDTLGPHALYAVDRIGLALRLPHWFQQGWDSRLKLVALRPAGTPRKSA